MYSECCVVYYVSHLLHFIQLSSVTVIPFFSKKCKAVTLIALVHLSALCTTVPRLAFEIPDVHPQLPLIWPFLDVFYLHSLLFTTLADFESLGAHKAWNTRMLHWRLLWDPNIVNIKRLLKISVTIIATCNWMAFVALLVCRRPNTAFCIPAGRLPVFTWPSLRTLYRVLLGYIVISVYVKWQCCLFLVLFINSVWQECNKVIFILLTYISRTLFILISL